MSDMYNSLGVNLWSLWGVTVELEVVALSMIRPLRPYLAKKNDEDHLVAKPSQAFHIL